MEKKTVELTVLENAPNNDIFTATGYSGPGLYWLKQEQYLVVVHNDNQSTDTVYIMNAGQMPIIEATIENDSPDDTVGQDFVLKLSSILLNAPTENMSMALDKDVERNPFITSAK